MSNRTPKQLEELGRKTIEQRQRYTRRHLARTALFMAKAVQAGIIVTQAEIDAEIKRRQNKK